MKKKSIVIVLLLTLAIKTSQFSFPELKLPNPLTMAYQKYNQTSEALGNFVVGVKTMPCQIYNKCSQVLGNLVYNEAIINEYRVKK